MDAALIDLDAPADDNYAPRSSSSSAGSQKFFVLGGIFFAGITFLLAIIGVSSPDLRPLRGDVAEINTQVLGLNTDLLNLLATSVTLNETMNVFESYQPQVVSLINGEIMSQSSREFVKAFDLTTASIRDGAILKVSDPDIVLTYIDSLMGYPRESPNVLTGTDEVLAFVLEYQEFYNPSISRLDLNGVWEVDIKTGLPLVDYTLQRTAVHDSQRVDSFGGASIYFSASLGPTGVTSQYSIIEATIRNDLMYVTNSTPA